MSNEQDHDRKLPQGWAWATLGELVGLKPNSITDGPFGSNLKTEHYTDAGPRVIRLQNIGDGTFRDVSAHISESHYGTLRKHAAFAGDIVIAAFGDPAPRACIVPDIGPAIVKADCIRLSPTQHVLPLYLTYALNSPGVRKRTTEKVHGVGRPRINLKEIKEIELPVAPTSEQKQIAEQIDALFTDLDSAVAALKRVRANLKRYRASVLKAACEGRLGPTTSTARIFRTRDCLVEPLANGRSPKQTKSGTQILKLTALQDGRIELAEARFGEVSQSIIDQLCVRAGDVFISRGNGSIRLVGLAGLVSCDPDHKVIFPDTMIRVRLNPTIVAPRYFTYIWNSRYVRRQVESTARTTAGIHKISQGDIEEFTLPVPDLEMQTRIVEELDRKLTGESVLATELQLALVRADRLRQSILKRAFEGQLVPQDPNDEPASVLLERIRAERAANANNNRKPNGKRKTRLASMAAKGSK